MEVSFLSSIFLSSAFVGGVCAAARPAEANTNATPTIAANALFTITPPRCVVPVVPRREPFSNARVPRQARVDRGREAMVKMTKLPAHMANQSRLFAAALCVSIVIGAVGSGAAEPLSQPAPADAQAALAPVGPGFIVPACDLPLGSLGERHVSDGGSVVLAADGGASDGWADAYAEGSRISYVAITAQ